MSWRSAHGWQSSSEHLQSSDDSSRIPKDRLSGTKPRSPPEDAEQAMWTVIRCIGPAYKWLCCDLFMLGATDDPINKEITDAFAVLLQKLGRRVLPTVGLQPMSKMHRARTDVQDLASLLASLACRQVAGDGNPSFQQNGAQSSAGLKDLGVQQLDEGSHVEASPHANLTETGSPSGADSALSLRWSSMVARLSSVQAAHSATDIKESKSKLVAQEAFNEMSPDSAFWGTFDMSAGSAALQSH